MSCRLKSSYLVVALAIIGCSERSTIDQGPSSNQNSVASSSRMDGLQFNGTGAVKTKAIYDGSMPVIIEAIVLAKSDRGEQAILSNCQASGFSLSIKDGQWTLYWHDGIKYKSISAPATLDKRTHLLGIIENSRMELRLDGISQGITRADGHRQSKLPFYIAADPKLDSQYKFDPSATEFPFTGNIYECRISNDPEDIAQAKLGNHAAKSERAFLHYVFDNGGDKAIDKSIHKHDGTIENGKWLPLVRN